MMILLFIPSIYAQEGISVSYSSELTNIVVGTENTYSFSITLINNTNLSWRINIIHSENIVCGDNFIINQGTNIIPMVFNSKDNGIINEEIRITATQIANTGSHTGYSFTIPLRGKVVKPEVKHTKWLLAIILGIIGIIAGAVVWIIKRVKK